MERKTMPRIVALLLAVLLTLTSVVSVPIDTQAATKPTKITLSAKKKTIGVGKSFKLSVKSVSPGDASKAVTYKSSNKKVATVSSKGKVTGKAAGKATITVTSKSNKKVKAKCTVTVKKKVEKIQTASSILMQKGKKVKLRYDIYPNKGVNKKVTFKSSKPAIVSVSKKGKLTAKKVGKAVITLRSADGGAKKKVKVTVKKPKSVKLVTKVTLDRETLSLLNGSSQTLHATVTPAKASKKKAYFVSSDTSVAVVNNNGRVTAKGDGTARIYAYAADNVANRAVCTVTVTSPDSDPSVVPGNQVKVTGVTLDRTELIMTAGAGTEQLKATVTPANATNPAVTWESSDTAVATVENGLVTPLRAGKATITVTTADGGYKASCEVTVNARYVPVENIILAPSMALEAGETSDPMVMAVIPTNATNQAVTWESNNQNVATVSADGRVTAVAAGTATITVTTEDGGKKASCEVTVRERQIIRVENVSVDPKAAELLVGGDTLQLSATVTPSNATDKTVVWASSNPEVASVSADGGLVTPLSAGRTMIYAQSNNGQRDYCEVVVRQKLNSISLDSTELTLKQGEQKNLTVTLDPVDAAVEKVEWLADSNVVEVLSEGVISADGKGYASVRAVGIGTAKVTVKVTTKDGEYTAHCDVTSEKLNIPVTGIALAPSKVTVPAGGTQELMPVWTPGNATDIPALTWTSSKPEVASVNEQTGVITAHAEGTATITAAAAGGLSATAEVTVVPGENYRPVSSIALSPASLSEALNVGETVSFTATVNPDDATDKEIEWTCTDENVISISGTGNTVTVKAEGAGTATLIAAAGGKTTTCDVTVYRALDSVELTCGQTTLELGEDGQIRATLSPVDATYKSIRWEYDSEYVSVVPDGTVNNGVFSGVIHTRKAGATTINVVVETADGRTVRSEQPVTLTISEPFVALNEIRFIREQLVMVAGNSTNLIALFDPENTTERKVNWASDNESVVKVTSENDNTAIVEALKEGTATITATVTKQDGTTRSKTIGVTVSSGTGDIRVDNIELNETELGFILGETPDTKTLVPTFTPSNATNQTVFWISTDEKVATVDAHGVVKAVGEGTTTIIAVTQDGGKSAKCNVTVSPRHIPVTTVTVTSPDGQTELKEGETKTFAAKVLPEEATFKEVTWSSSNPDVATVDSKTGTVTAVAAGETVITATATKDNISGTITVKVYVPATKVTITPPAENELEVNGTMTLTASVEPTEATYKELTWSSLNPEIATVDENGVVTGAAKGEATIRATEAHDGEYDEYTVKVYVPVTDITITSEDETPNLMVADTMQLTAEITPEDADYTDITWSSSDESIATVDKNGVVTGVAKGTATITATAEHDGVSKTFDVHVFVPATKITLDQSDIRVKLNNKDTIQLTATIEPEDALEFPDLEVNWESDESRVVTAVPSIDGMSASLVLSEEGMEDADEFTATITAKISDEVKATCKVTVVRREKAFTIKEDDYGAPAEYILNFDRTADEYEVIRGENGMKALMPAEYVEHDYNWLVSKFEAGVYDNNFLKNYWEKFNWETLKNESLVLNEILVSNLLYGGEDIDVEVTSSTEIVITIKKDGKTKTITVTRVDLANGSELIVTSGAKQVRISNINISEENGVVSVSATVNTAGGMNLKAEISKDSFTLYRELNGRDRVVIEANVTEEQYTCRVNAIYYEEIMNQLGYVYDPSKMDAYNIYKKAVQ